MYILHEFITSGFINVKFGIFILVCCFTVPFAAITHNKRREAIVSAAYSDFELYRLMRLSRGRSCA